MKKEINKKKKNIKPQSTNLLNNKKFIITIILFIVCSIFLIGSSYAIFKVTVKSDKDNIINVAKFKVDYEDSDEINLENTYPMSYNEAIMQDGYTFTLTNNGTINNIYKIYLEEDETDDNSLIKDYIMLSYKKGNDPYTIPVKLSSLTNNTILENEPLSNELNNNSITYTIKMWLDESAPNSIQKASYKAKIKVYTSQEIEE